MGEKYWVGYAGLPGREIKFLPDRKSGRYTSSGPIYFKIGNDYEKCGIIELRGFDSEIGKKYMLQVKKYKRTSPKKLIVLVKYHTKEQKDKQIEAILKPVQLPHLERLKKRDTQKTRKQDTTSKTHEEHTVELGKRRRAAIVRYSDNNNAIVELDGREINLGRLDCNVDDVVEFVEVSKAIGVCLHRRIWMDGYLDDIEEMVSGKLPSLPAAETDFAPLDDTGDTVGDLQIDVGDTQEREKRTHLATVRAEKHRQDVFDTYGSACVVCGYQVVSEGGLFGCEAVHIRSVEHDGIDGAKNGLPMCRNDHWLFDEGILAIDDDYRIIVDKTKLESSTINLESYHGQPLHIPNEVEIRPSIDNIRHHRSEHNVKSTH